MSYVSRKINPQTPKVPMRSKSHANFMGGPSYDISPLTCLRAAAASCFFGEPRYYMDANATGQPRGNKRSARKYIGTTATRAQKTLLLNDYVVTVLGTLWTDHFRSTLPKTATPAQILERVIDNALDFDAEKTLQIAAALRNVDNIRTTPQVILVRAARHIKVIGTGLIRKYASQIVKRADEPAVGLAYFFATYGKDTPIPNSLKRAWRDFYAQATPYSLAKYRLSGHKVNTLDVISLVHPPRTEAVDGLCKGTLSLEDQTWEAIISAEGSNTQSWTKALDVMGHMALLRNIRNLIEKGVPQNLFIDKLIEGATRGKQLPFRYWSAYRAVTQGRTVSGPVLDAIETALVTSMQNVPKFHGRVMSLCDNSGSAQCATLSYNGTVAVNEIANLSGVITGMNSDDGYVGIFGDGLTVLPVRKRESIFTQLDKANNVGRHIGSGTENGIWLFWDQAIREREHWDVVFVYSDMQAGHGGLYGLNPTQYNSRGYGWYRNSRCIDVPKLVATYRKEVNPNVIVFLVQVAGYTDSIFPEYYDKTYILGGWGDGILRFAGAMIDLNTKVQTIQ